MGLKGRPSFANNELEEVKLKVGFFLPVGIGSIIKFPALVRSCLDVRHHNEGIRWVQVRVVLGEYGIQEGNFGKKSTLPDECLELDQAHLISGLHKDVKLPGLCPADWVRGVQ